MYTKNANQFSFNLLQFSHIFLCCFVLLYLIFWEAKVYNLCKQAHQKTCINNVVKTCFEHICVVCYLKHNFKI